MLNHHEELTGKIIHCAIAVHKTLGPGLLESTYEQCLGKEFNLAGISYKSQMTLPLNYKNEIIDTGYRIDLLIEYKEILASKCVKTILPIHEAQILTYMKLADIKVGLLINFYSTLLKDGVKRLVI